jgi:hypothetical protein
VLAHGGLPDADQIDATELHRGQAGRPDSRGEQFAAPQETRPHQRFQLGPGHPHVPERLGHRHVCLGVPGQAFLGVLDVVQQGPPDTPVGNGPRAQHTLPPGRTRMRRRTPDVHQQGLVDD